MTTKEIIEAAGGYLCDAKIASEDAYPNWEIVFYSAQKALGLYEAASKRKGCKTTLEGQKAKCKKLMDKADEALGC